jgi:uncharacterized protein YbbC (DUF1343 family)
MSQVSYPIVFTIIFLGLIFPQKRKQSIHQQQSTYYKTKVAPPLEKVNVLSGLDVLLEKKPHFIQTRTIGLVTNQTGIDKAGVPNYKRLMEMEDVDLKVIFSPEHGLFGEASDGEQVYYDSLGPELPEVISLYGSTRKPTPEMLSGINLIIYDIQDIGTRFYTFISTLGLVMEAAAESNIPVLVLDRPNPIRGDIVEGPLLNMEFRSFVGYYPIPIRYGRTVGELAQDIIANNWISPAPTIEIISMDGWSEDLWFDETNLIWVNPSPNIPDLETAIIYPGMCLIEGTNISEGRGTPHPFKWIGAPWIEGKDLSQALNKFDLPGVVFVPRTFTPVKIPGKAENPKFEGQKCKGVEIWVTDRNTYRSIDTGLLTLFTIHEMYNEKTRFREKHLNMLWGNDKLFKELVKGSTGLYFLKHHRN